MHLVFLNQYYPPDAAPTGVMLEAVVRHLAEEGHEVTVLCARGGYASTESNIETPDSRVQMDRGIYSASSSSIQPSTFNDPLIHIIRIPATQFGRGSAIHKLIDYASFYLMVAWKLATLRPDPDRVVALTTPPYLSVLARLISKFLGADHAHWVMDLYPDVMVAHGMLADGGRKHRLLASIARWGFSGKRCATVLTLGPDMAERCRRLIVREESPESRIEMERGIYSASSSDSDSQQSTISNHLSPVEWVPLWGTGEEKLKPEIESLLSHNSQLTTSPSALRTKRGWFDHELIVMYSGNMGLGHRFGEFLEAALQIGRGTSATVADIPDSNHQPSTPCSQLLPNPQSSSCIRFVFYGGGKRRLEVENFISHHPDCRVELHDYAPTQDLSAHLQSADVHLASLDAAWSGTMVPSKLQGIFAVGRPVIFVGSSQSSIGRWVIESGGGWVVEPGDVSGLLVALHEAGDRETRNARGQAAWQFAGSHFNKTSNAARVAALLTR